MENNEKTLRIMIGEEDIHDRCDFLETTVNEFFDSASGTANSIRYQACAPVHGISFEEMRFLLNIVDSAKLEALVPVLGVHDALMTLIREVMSMGAEVTESLFEKVNNLDDNAALEIAYRIYVFNTAKRRVSEFFRDL